MREEVIFSYAQNQEDVILSAFFDESYKGFYVDVGASHPEKYSVTKYFYDRGWRGINIEPNEKLVKLLQASRKRDVNLAVAVSEKSGKMNFRQYEADGLSTLSTETKESLEGQEVGALYTDIEINVLTLSEVLDAYAPDKEIDFLKIDVEGFESEVLAGNNWDKYRPRVICIEADKIRTSWPQYLTDKQYMKVFNDGLNDYYVDKRNKPEFDYLHMVIARTIYPAGAKGLFDEVERARSSVAKSTREIDRLQKAIEVKDEEIVFLNQHIYELNRFKTLVKSLFFKIHSIIDVRLADQYKRKKMYPKMDIDISEMDPAGLTEVIHRNDVEAFLRKPKPSERAKINIARNTHRVYKKSAKTFKGVAKRAKRSIQKHKTGGVR